MAVDSWASAEPYILATGQKVVASVARAVLAAASAFSTTARPLSRCDRIAWPVRVVPVISDVWAGVCSATSAPS